MVISFMALFNSDAFHGLQQAFIEMEKYKFQTNKMMLALEQKIIHLPTNSLEYLDNVSDREKNT